MHFADDDHDQCIVEGALAAKCVSGIDWLRQTMADCACQEGLDILQSHVPAAFTIKSKAMGCHTHGVCMLRVACLKPYQ